MDFNFFETPKHEEKKTTSKFDFSSFSNWDNKPIEKEQLKKNKQFFIKGDSGEFIRIIIDLSKLDISKQIKSQLNLFQKINYCLQDTKSNKIIFPKNLSEELIENNIYTIRKYLKSSINNINDPWNSIENENLTKIDVGAFDHFESNFALEILQRGSNLLKLTKDSGFHFRFFQVYKKECLYWYTGTKSREQCSLKFEDILEIKIGQKTPKFLKNSLEKLSHLSFGIIYQKQEKNPSIFSSNEKKFLEIVCKNQKEFDIWLCGLKALTSFSKNSPISKEILLSHSKRFEYLNNEKLLCELNRYLLEDFDYESLILEDFLFKDDKEIKIEKIAEKALLVKKNLIETDKIVEKYREKSKDTGLQERNLNVENDKEIIKKKELRVLFNISDFEKITIVNLFDDCFENLKKVIEEIEGVNQNEYLEYFVKDTNKFDIDKNSQKFYELLNRNLVFIEINIDNILDIAKRIENPFANKNKAEKILFSFEKSIKNSFSNFEKSCDKLKYRSENYSDEIKSKIDNFKSDFSKFNFKFSYNLQKAFKKNS